MPFVQVRRDLSASSGDVYNLRAVYVLDGTGQCPGHPIEKMAREGEERFLRQSGFVDDFSLLAQHLVLQRRVRVSGQLCALYLHVGEVLIGDDH